MLIALARVPDGGSRSAAELAASQRVPYPLARGILSDLAHCDLVTTRRGAGGGVILARPASHISVLSIIECIEGRLALGLCTNDPKYCDQVGVCVMHGVWKQAEVQLRAFLENRSLAYLAADRDASRFLSSSEAEAASEGGEADT